MTLLHDTSLYVFRRLQAVRHPTPRNEIFISGSIHTAGWIARAQKLLFHADFDRVMLHAVGAAMHRAVLVALRLMANHRDWLETDTQTSSLRLLDEYEPLVPDLPYVQQVRVQSAIHIQVFKTKRAPPV